MGKPLPGRDPLVGQVVGGRYEIVRLIGRGGMGAIYEVRNTRLGRAFALKMLIGEAAEDDEVLARFRREADVIAKIKHPNIVEVIDWEQLEDGSPCMVLEYLQGEDLGSRIRAQGQLAWPLIAMVGDQVLGALSVAHAAGVVHRDLKPQNIFLSVDDAGEERVKLLDFGVSKIRDSRSLVTTDARLIGTPSYMSPEQAEGRHDDVGPQTDLWAVGAIMYEMATGDLAFEGASMPAVLYRICSKDADRVDGSRVDAPLPFTELIASALTRELPKRVARADVFRARLREALADVGGNLRYTDRMAAPAVRPTPLTLSMQPPTPNRKKRQTGAHDVTLASQETPVAASLTPAAAGQISAATYVPPRSSPLLLAIVAALAGAMIVAVVVVALTRTGQPPPQAAIPQKVAEPPPPVDAAPIVIDAYVAPVVAEPPAPAPAPTPRHVKPAPLPPQAPIEKAVAPPEPPKKKGCEQYDRNSKEYTMCVMGDGT
jgi:serine/threonine protein kinase